MKPVYISRAKKCAFLIVFLSIFIAPTIISPAPMISNITLFYEYIFLAGLIILSIIYLQFENIRFESLIALSILIMSFASPYAIDKARATTGSENSSPDIKIATYNWRIRNRGIDQFAHWSSNSSLDIVSIQESYWFIFKKYKHISQLFPYNTGSLAQKDAVILSKFPILDQKIYKVGDRNIIYAVIKTPSGPVTFFNLHAPTVTTSESWSARNAYLARASELFSAAEGPVVVMGDFNATVWDPAFRRIISDASLHSEPNLFPQPTRILKIINGHSLGAPIDHILVSKGINISQCNTGPAMGSDHRPLSCILKFSSASAVQ